MEQVARPVSLGGGEGVHVLCGLRSLTRYDLQGQLLAPILIPILTLILILVHILIHAPTALANVPANVLAIDPAKRWVTV